MPFPRLPLSYLLIPFCLAAWAGGLPVASRLRAQAEPARVEYVSQTWTTEDGLPHSRVGNIVQDPRGFIWVATPAGLTRFDGRVFKDFPVPRASQTHGPGIRGFVAESPDVMVVIPSANEVLRLENGVFSPHPITPHLAGQVLSDIFAEPDGTLWVGTMAGALFRWQAGEIQTFGKEAGIDRRAPLFSFAIDGENRTWIATGGFLGHYEHGRLVPWPEPQGRVLTIAAARSGGLWLLADGKLRKLERDAITTVVENPPWMALRASVRRMFEDREGRLWIAATRQGIFWFQDGSFTHAPVPHTTYTDLGEDREGNLLLGSEDDGFSLMRRKRFRAFDRAAGLANRLVFGVCEDAVGRVWLANSRGGLFRWWENRLDRAWPNEINRVCPDAQGNLWLASPDGLYRFSPDGGGPPERVEQPVRVITTLFATRAGDLWLDGVEHGPGILRAGAFQPVAVPAEGKITAITEDKDGTVWAGSASGELFQLKEGRLAPFMPGGAWPGARVHSLLADEDGRLWIGTAEGLFLQDQGRRHRFTEAEGVGAHLVLQIMNDDLGRLWLGGSRGFFHVSRDELLACAAGTLKRVNMLALGKAEGMAGVLPVTESQPAAWKDRAGHLWFATLGGAIRLDPAALATPAPSLSVLLDEVRIDDIGADPHADTLLIPPGRHRLELRFVAPSPTPANVRFRHQMEGFDPEWIEGPAGQPISYSRLPPGRYRLRVMARDGRGPWSDSDAGRVVVVEPEWWQRSSVRLAGALAGLALVTLLIRHVSQLKLRRRIARIEKESALERERTRIARDIHDELGGGVAGVRFLVGRLRDGAPAATTGRVVEQLARQTQQLAFDLERVVWTVHPRSNTLDRLATFVGRFVQNLLQGAAVNCVVRHLSEIPARPMTPETQHHILAITKETLTNVLKHSGATEVTVETIYRDGMFTLTLSDDGRGFDPLAPEHSERNGLSNMRGRAGEMGGRIEIESAPGRGSVVRLSVPAASGSPAEAAAENPARAGRV